VFILYGLAFGLLVGLLAGGRLERLGDISVRWWPLAISGLLVQLVVFSPAGDGIPGDVASLAYSASTAAVLVVVLRNIRLPGLPLIALGATLNLLAIIANGGHMPADPNALIAAGRASGTGANSNGSVVAHPLLAPLTDIFAIPAGVPLANVFSIGDVLIGLGVAIALVGLMRSGGDLRHNPVVHSGNGGA
jgi:hypothetical protein